MALYCLCSVALNFINKGTLMVYSQPNTILLLQMVFAVAILTALRVGRRTAGWLAVWNLAPLSKGGWWLGIRHWPIGLCFCKPLLAL